MRFCPEILMEDGDVLICRKPAGIPVQAKRRGQLDFEGALKNYRALKQEPPEIYVVHRLDQPVEGIMVFARNARAAAILSRQVQEKSVEKQYLALAEGQFPEKTGHLEDYLLKDGKNNTSQVVPKGTKGAKAARLSYEVEKVILKSEQSAGIFETSCQSDSVSLLRIWLDTGRHHQIRVQMAHAGHPLVGDKKYNQNCPKGYMPVGLCSVRTSFRHPKTGEWMEFAAEPEGKLFMEFKE